MTQQQNQSEDQQQRQAREQEEARNRAAQNAGEGMKDKEAQTSDSYGKTRESGEGGKK